jgi:Phosphotransferase enzyme family
MNLSNSHQDVQVLLGESYIQRLFQVHLAGENETITEFRKLHTHYKEFFKAESQVKSNLAIVYELTFCNCVKGKTRRQIAFAKKFHPGYSREVFTKFAALVHPPLHLEDESILIWLFPNDPVLPHLPEAVEAERVRKYLPVATNEVKVEIVNYRPEIRCTAWYELDNKTKLFGKTYADGRYKDIYERLQWMWNYTKDKDAFLMPPLAGYSDDIKTFWQYELEGTPLLDLITPASYDALLKQAAQRLHFLNQCGIPCPARESNEEQLKEVNKKIKKLSLVFPELQPRLAKLASELGIMLAGLEPALQWVVHGDFHLRQMHVHQGDIALFDFDECSLGDPVEDLAHFIADLYTYTFEQPFIEAMSQTFLAAYCDYSGWHVPTERLTWHLQIQLINRAYRSYLQQKPDLARLVESYILLAEIKGNTSPSFTKKLSDFSRVIS